MCACIKHIDTCTSTPHLRVMSQLSLFWSLGRKACPGTVWPHWCDEYQKCLPTTFPFTLSLTQEELLPLTPDTGPTLQMIWHEASPTLDALLPCERRSCSEFALSGNSYLYIAHLFFPLRSTLLSTLPGLPNPQCLAPFRLTNTGLSQYLTFQPLSFNHPCWDHRNFQSHFHNLSHVCQK